MIATKIVSTNTECKIGMPSDASNDEVIALTCVVVPLPNMAVMVPKRANAIAKGFHFFPNPISI